MLTEERGKKLADYLSSDTDRANRLLALSPEEALKIINADGYDFTEAELIEFGDILASVSDKKELSEDELSDVAGGLGVVATYAIAIGIATACGYGVGRLGKW